MKKLTLLTILTLLACNLWAQTSWLGQSSNQNYISTGMPILLIAPDAVSSGMGDVGTATTPDAYSAHWNNAKFAFVEGTMGISTTLALPEEIAMAIAGLISPCMALAMMIPAGPTMISASFALNTAALSPVAAKDGPPFIMFSVAAEFVPTAPISAAGKFFTRSSTSERPIPPPCPSITTILMTHVPSPKPITKVHYYQINTV